MHPMKRASKPVALALLFAVPSSCGLIRFTNTTQIATVTTVLVQHASPAVDDRNLSTCAVSGTQHYAAPTKKYLLGRDELNMEQQMLKLRICNAGTLDRTAELFVKFNDKLLNQYGIPKQKCVEYEIKFETTNHLALELSGEVSATWSEVMSGEHLKKVRALFLIGYVYGRGQDTAFSVTTFHGKYRRGLRTVQVAYLDIRRGHPAEAELQLLGRSGDFVLQPGTFKDLCAGEYALQFVRPERDSPLGTSARLVASVNEVYVVMRVAPEGYDEDREAALVYPEEKWLR